MTTSLDWLASLARRGPDDLRRISALVDQLTVADRATADTAQSMLAASPLPATHEEARARCAAVLAFLERPGRTRSNHSSSAR